MIKPFKNIISYASILVIVITCAGRTFNKDYENFTKKFVKSYADFTIPDLTLSYITNFQSIQSLDTLQKQKAFFSQALKELYQFSRQSLSVSERHDFDLIEYECKSNLDRLALEIPYKLDNRPVLGTGLAQVVNGKEWYRYYLNKWVASNVTPDEIYNFGLSEIARVQAEMNRLQLKANFSDQQMEQALADSSNFVRDTLVIQALLYNAKKKVIAHLPKIFNVQQTPDLAIERGRNEVLKNTPGYYTANVFYYNYFDEPFNKRQIDWLFIHEGIPGHHYQLSVLNQLSTSPLQDLFYYSGFNEGWAAYVEEYGHELGLYETILDEYGKLEWDLVRCVRVSMDVGLNYMNWTEEKALDFWKQFIHGKDDIGVREIKRMIRWPAQVISYRYGANQLIEMKNYLKKANPSFDLKAFHDKVLNSGPLPFPVLKKVVYESSISAK